MARKGEPISAEHRARIAMANRTRAHRRGWHHTIEAKTAIAASKRGKKLSPEHIAKRSASRRGVKTGPLSIEHRAKISAAHMGLSHPVSAEQKAKLSVAMRGRKMSQEWRDKIGAAHRGTVRSPEARAKMSEAAIRSFESGRRAHLPCLVSRYTKLAQALHRHLASTGLRLLPEVRFGRFTVDLYDPLRHVAYEADGRYWHERAERENPGCGLRRDQYLSDHYGVRVIHFDELEIKRLARECAA